MRKEPPTTHEKLRAFLHKRYDLDTISLEFLPVGDTHSAIYRIETSPGPAFLLKLRPSIEEARLRTSRYLRDHGIDAVIAPVATDTATLSAHFESWTAVLFPYVEGETGWNTITSAHWQAAGRIFQHIHMLAIKPSDMSGIHREAFAPSVYSAAIDSLETQLAAPGEAGTQLDLLQTAWRKHQTTIHALIASMRQLAATLKTQALPFVICHADLHPGNLLRDSAGRVFVIDWDDVMLAPKERDFIFVGDPADGMNPASPFFVGYGPAGVNWAAVTYYRYERVVQDLIEYARDVFRDTLSETARLRSIERFVENLEGRNFAAAEVAAEHLPPDLLSCAVRRTE